MSGKAKVPHKEPWKPPVWDRADAGALQALARGECEPHQQKRVLDFIIHSLAGTYDLSYRPGDTHDTAFAEGRRFVGLQIVKLINVNLEKLKDA